MFCHLFPRRFQAFSLSIVALLMCGHFSTTSAQNVFFVPHDATFDIGNSGASHYLFNWETFSNVQDPTLHLVVGRTYTFRRTSGSHPFAITDDTLGVTGTDGSFSRTGTNIPTLEPAADFTANPSPTTDVIQWTPTNDDIGRYYYTCTVPSHFGMTGSIVVDGALKGDVDLSGVVDFSDIPPFISVLQSGVFQHEADCDCSGEVDFADIPAFIGFLQGQ